MSPPPLRSIFLFPGFLVGGETCFVGIPPSLPLRIASLPFGHLHGIIVPVCGGVAALPEARKTISPIVGEHPIPNRPIRGAAHAHDAVPIMLPRVAAEIGCASHGEAPPWPACVPG